MIRFIGLAAVIVLLTVSPVRACNSCGAADAPPAPPAPKARTDIARNSKVPLSVIKAADRALKHGEPNYRYDVEPPITLYPERVIWIKISSTDVNRIVCTSGSIVPEDVVTSKEKGAMIEVARNGYEAYLKLKARKNASTGKIEYQAIPIDVYMSCGGETYGFIARPEKIPSRTIYLISPSRRIDQGRKSLKSSEIDKAVVEIWKHVLRDRIPPAWESVHPRRTYARIKGAVIRGEKSWEIPGVGVLVRELSVTAVSRTRLRETDLLRPSVTLNPFALLVEKPGLAPGERTRAIILEKVVSHGL